MTAGAGAALAFARIGGRALSVFPGTVPATLAEAYSIQDEGIAALDLVPAAWKVGTIAPGLQPALSAARLVGPAVTLSHAAAGTTTEVRVIRGGFAAIEAEIALQIGTDLPNRDRPYVRDELASAVSAARWAVEVAGSSLETILELGPLAVVADLGNNAAVVLGAPIPDWSRRALSKLAASVSIDGNPRGTGSAANVPDGLLAALAFLVANLATRGRWLRRGDWVSTGAMTGVHPIAPGSVSTVEFGGATSIAIRIV